MYRIITFAGLLLIALGLYAQPAAVAFESAHHENFWVYINNQEQNKQSIESLQLTNLQANVNYSVRIVLDNKHRSTFVHSITLRPGNNGYIVSHDARHRKVSIIPTDRHINARFSIPAVGVPQPPQPNHPGGNHHGQPGQPGQPGDNHHGQPGQPGGNHHGQPGQPGDNHHGQPGQPGDNHHGHQGGDEELSQSVPVPAPCSDNDFLAAKSHIAAETFESNKLDLAKQVVSHELMTVNQLSEIARLFTFESSKLEFLKFAYDFCYDKNRYYMVNSVFTYSSSKDEMNEFLHSR